MPRQRQSFGAAVKERGCAVFTFVLVTLPLWALTLAWRGPVFAIGALAVLLLALFAFAAIQRLLGRD